ncbi:oligosaccharide flippase family protein [Marinagarivorans cellulosilyticus]|uniref:Polysaccharide biosynthesis protein n=1 Tax=Marinagarivorans cellulosilyticus TaxID=2721545 RepID=A0AAN2BKG7_9GAMM|nr:oligosaccharide flippase family protein [Marinagarivorans cellulosilyticus]BCD98058.1 hypothetical protein MARGE09_P2259 [Marinagarivorans cellulosilyticus]
MSEGGSISSKTTETVKSGAVWTVLGFGFQKILQLSSSLVLTRLLFPEAFGLMALVNVFIMGLIMLSDVGIKPAIVQMSEGADEDFLNTAWTIQVVRGFVLWLLLCITAYPLSIFYGEPDLFKLLIFCGSISAISGFATIGMALAQRDMKVKRSISVKLAGQVFSIFTMITLALTYKSVWALAVGTVVGVVVEVIAGYLLLGGHRHRLQFHFASALSLLRFGKWIFFSTLLFYIGGQGSRAIQGGLVSVEELGIIAIAATISLMPGELVQQLVSRLVFPVLSRVNRENSEQFVPTLKAFRLRVVACALPLFLVISMVSSFAIGLLYDERYALAGPILAIMVLSESILTLTLLYKNAFLALGRVNIHFLYDLLLAIVRVAGMLVGFYSGGILGMFFGVGVGNIIFYCVVTIFAQRARLTSLGVDFFALLGLLLFGVLSMVINLGGEAVFRGF